MTASFDRTDDPLLLTPGPLTTTRATKQAMLRDWGSWDADFRAITRRVRERLLQIAEAGTEYSCVPMQGSGTFAVEAALGTLIPRAEKTLVLINGAYGKRAAQCLNVMGRAVETFETAEDTAPDPAELDAFLAADTGIATVVLIHCETTSGILNPLDEIAAICRSRGRKLILDAMSTFGALPIATAELGLEAVIASANKCLEGVPGFGFVIARTEALEAAAGNAHSLSLDLAEQWSYMEKTGQWRFTPPTHVVVALDAAIAQHAAEGGVAARGGRYAENHRVAVEGLDRLGLAPLVAPEWQSPIITTFRAPEHPGFDFGRFYELLKADGFIIYPGKMTAAETFRIGHIGAIDAQDMTKLVEAVGRALDTLGVDRPAAA